MAIDINLVNDIDQFFANLLQSQARSLIYMRRFTRDFAPYGRCSYCYDDNTGQITNARCPICYGTGFDKGYSDPVQGINSPPHRVYGFFTRSHYTTDWQKTGVIAVQEDLLLYAKLPFQPGLSDLIIDEDDTYYLVGNHIEDWTWNGQRYGYVMTVYAQDRQNSWRYQVLPPPPFSGNDQFDVSNLNIQIGDDVQIEFNSSCTMEIQLIS